MYSDASVVRAFWGKVIPQLIAVPGAVHESNLMPVPASVYGVGVLDCAAACCTTVGVSYGYVQRLQSVTYMAQKQGLGPRFLYNA